MNGEVATTPSSAGRRRLDTRRRRHRFINGGLDADVIEWQAGDSGADTITGFNLAEDRLWFGPGYFAVDPPERSTRRRADRVRRRRGRRARRQYRRRAGRSSPRCRTSTPVVDQMITDKTVAALRRSVDF